MFLLVLLGTLGFSVPGLRQIVGFIYLTFIPGFLLVLILKLNKERAIETLIYSVGLSLAFTMFLGLIINIIYPLIGILKPISALPLIITFIVVTAILTLVLIKREGNFSMVLPFKLGELVAPQVLFLILLPLVAVLGARLVQVYLNNAVLVLLICILCMVPVLAMFTGFIPSNYYPLVIYCVALALLWHFSLVSEYLIQYDSFLEYHFFDLANSAGLWDFHVQADYNAMLSVTILPAVFCQVMDITGTVMFKAIYQVWYALVPLVLYLVYTRIFGSRRAFWAAFFYMSFFVYFLNMPASGKHMVADLFCSLLVMQAVDKGITPAKKGLFIIWGACLAVSLYSLSYLYAGMLLITALMLLLLRVKNSPVNIFYVTLFTVICLTWFMYIASASPFNTFVSTGYHIYTSISRDFFNIFSRDIHIVLTSVSPDAVHLISRILMYLILLFLAIGAFNLISLMRQKAFFKEYAILSLANYFLLGACIIIPYFSNALGGDRMMHIALMLLAPFCIIGAETVFIGFQRVFQFLKHTNAALAGQRLFVAVVLLLFFLFSTTLPYEIAGSTSGRSYPLVYGHLRNGDKTINLDDTIAFWVSSPTEQDVYSAEWLKKVRDEEKDIFGSYWQLGVPSLVSYGAIPPSQTINLTPLTTLKDWEGNYIYLNYVNTVLDYGTTTSLNGQPAPFWGNIFHWDINRIRPLLNSSSKVYSNGASDIYYSQ